MITETIYQCIDCHFYTGNEQEADEHSEECDHAVMDYEFVDWPEPSKVGDDE